MTQPSDIDVLIVGAGPTGLTMACLLAQYGVSFRIIDKKEGIATRSKALAIQARTMELFEQLGISEKAVSQGQPATGLDMIVNGKLRVRLNLNTYGIGLTKYPYMLIHEQSKTEQLLVDKLKQLGKEVDWQHEFIKSQQNSDQVEVTIQNQGQSQVCRARYIVAADGASSPVRHQFQLPFVGGTYQHRFMLMDVSLRWPFSQEHIALCISENGFDAFFPMVGDRRFRIIGLLSDAIPEDVEAHFEDIVSEVKKESGVPMEISDPKWISTYRLHHRYVSQFKVGECFFAGNAAHIHSPAGGQGMNTGIQDSFNLAWKLNMVLKGIAQENILETYHDERFPIARKLTRTTDKAFSLATSANPLVKWLRLNVMPLIMGILSHSAGFKRFAFRTVSQIAIHYRESSLSSVNGGDRFPLAETDGLFHAYFKVEAAEKIKNILGDYLGTQIKFHDSVGAGLILVRPDQYVAYTAKVSDTNDLVSYLKRHFKGRSDANPRS
jgi:2-polyprenyl-6-methoxyphenol hydroxylase-like FAD-dependent oxidoreductase